ncbi:MAG: YIEGIA family protein [Firmicutes bacterium]|nr:YIEGIA family protein [Bacillota bacterium]
MSGGSGPTDWAALVVGLAAGLAARLASMDRERRHYPAWPGGYITQLTMAAIAALIGGAVVPALVSKNWTAATFLTLAATQFIGLRQTEMKTLQAEEDLILVGRGPAYIMGIATTFESRNFLAMLVAAIGSLATHFLKLDAGILVAMVTLVASMWFTSGSRVGEHVRVRQGKVRFEKGTLLFVDDVMLMEVGLPHSRERFLAEGIGVVLEPITQRGESMLWNIGQRQAIAHEAAAAVGVQKDIGYPEQTPLVRMKMPYPDGTAALFILPVVHDFPRLKAAIEATPVLESVRSQKWPLPHVRKREVLEEGRSAGLRANGPAALRPEP